jgi:AcrR family transcriptional regulator
MTDTTIRSQARPNQTRRYLAKRELILVTAAETFNRLGVGGATLADVASAGELNLTGIRHYFTRKDELVAAAYDRSLSFHEKLFAEASVGRTARERVELLVRAYFTERARIAAREAPEYLHFGDFRALSEPTAAPLKQRFVGLFRSGRALLVDGDWRTYDRSALNAAAHMLISHFFWSVVWQLNHTPDDFGRLADRFLDILLNGLAGKHARWNPQPVDLPDVEPEKRSVESFLRAATLAINAEGYRNASVDRISARLNVTKGSFYHHLDGKDDLVVACFNRTFDILRRSQRLAVQPNRNGLQQAVDSVSGLVCRQVTTQTPLLRTSALTSVGPDMRRTMRQEMDMITARFSDMISDGMIDGSIRICDANMAGQMLTAIVNAAEELDRWAAAIDAKSVLPLYVRPLFYGLLTSLRSA